MQVHSGVAKKQWAKVGVTPIDERIVKYVYLNLHGRWLAMFSMYAPSDDENQQIKDSFYN